MGFWHPRGSPERQASSEKRLFSSIHCGFWNQQASRAVRRVREIVGTDVCITLTRNSYRDGRLSMALTDFKIRGARAHHDALEQLQRGDVDAYGVMAGWPPASGLGHEGHPVVRQDAG